MTAKCEFLEGDNEIYHDKAVRVSHQLDRSCYLSKGWNSLRYCEESLKVPKLPIGLSLQTLNEMMVGEKSLEKTWNFSISGSD
jgi:hypothetical protein